MSRSRSRSRNEQKQELAGTGRRCAPDSPAVDILQPNTDTASGIILPSTGSGGPLGLRPTSLRPKLSASSRDLQELSCLAIVCSAAVACSTGFT